MHMNAKTIETNDVGTPERALRQGGISLAPRTISEGGIETSVGAQANAECVLDALYLSGQLNGTQGARADRAAVGKSRYQQGLWLRELSIDAGLVPMRAANINAGGGGGEMSDATADKRAQFTRTVRDVLKVFGNGTIAVVCFDQAADSPAKLSVVQSGLDRLCLERGA